MKKTPKPRDTVQRLKETIHKQPAVFAVYVALRLIVLAELVMSIIRGEYESAFICLLVLALFILPFFIQQNFGIQLPSVLEIIILLFIFAAEILGSWSVTSSPTPTGTPCSTPPRASSAPPQALPLSTS
ncbi:MAG: hypothetical protein ACLR01_08405 [Vescimonas sp.]